MQTSLEQLRAERVQAFLEALPDDIFVVNAQGDVLEYRAGINPCVPVDNFLGTHLLEIMDPSAFELVLRAMQSCATDVAQTQVPINNQYFEVRCSRLPDHTVMVIFRDITSQHQLEHLKSQFMASVSHELNTPLAAILGFSELLQMTEPLSEEGMAYLDSIQHSTLRLRDILSNLLDSSRIESGQFAVRLRLEGVQDMLQEVCTSFIGLSKLAKIDYSFNIAPCTLEVDTNRLAQVAGNLLSNAFKFCPQGGRIVLKASVQPQHYCIEVFNTGDAIPKHEQSELFTRYGRTKAAEARGIDGNGLGLFICKAIVDSHDGQIEYQDGPNQGCVFVVRLPLPHHGVVQL